MSLDRTEDGEELAAEVLERFGTWARAVTPPQPWNAVALSTLSRLCRLGPQRLGDLVAAEDISQPGMTGLVSRMAAAGLLVRQGDPEDRRVTLVAATPAGHDYLNQVHRERAAVIAAHLRRLTPDERSALHAALTALDALAGAAPAWAAEAAR